MLLWTIAKMVTGMARAPFRRASFEKLPLPRYATDYSPPLLAESRAEATLLAEDIPTANSTEGQWTEFPAPVLQGCDEPLAEGAVDLRGVWRAYRGPMKGHVERIEQAGDRVVITAAQIIHDMRATGRTEDGVNDVAGGTRARISVAAKFENRRLNLRPGGKIVAVTRWIDEDGDLRWRWGPYFNRLKRVPPPTHLVREGEASEPAASRPQP